MGPCRQHCFGVKRSCPIRQSSGKKLFLFPEAALYVGGNNWQRQKLSVASLFRNCLRRTIYLPDGPRYV